MTYHELVDAVRAAYAQADASEIKEHIAFQFNIEGEGEGAFYLEIADGQIHIEPYEYYDRDVLFTTKAETLLKIGTGKLDPILAFTIGKLKVEGDIDKALALKKITPKSVTVPDAAALEPEDASEPSDAPVEETVAPTQETAASETLDVPEDTVDARTEEPEKEKKSALTAKAPAGSVFAKKRPGHKAKKKRR